MQIIDDKGKILGKFNIIDLIILMFMILIFITGYKYLYLENYPENLLDKLNIAEKPIWINVTTINIIPKLIFENMFEGDFMRNEDVLKNEVIGKIISIDAVEKNNKETISKTKFSLLVNKKPNSFLYNRKRLILWDDFVFDTEKYSITGKIIKIEN